MNRNRVVLNDLADLNVGAIAALSAEELMMLAEEIQESQDHTKRLKEKLDTAIDRKYGVRAATARREEGKDTGSVRFSDGIVTIVADLPKRVQWDQKMLAVIAEEIRTSGDDPAEYLTTELKVSERSYGAWPSSIRSAFEPARTVKTGKPTYQFVRSEEP
ncbi:Phage protein, HK97 gp10 family [Azospirillaceae bacterium]